VEESSGPTMITFDCGHVSKFANHFHYVVGSETYCFKCGEEARAERKSLTNLDLISLSETSDR
jgi:hypothetical protein